MTVNEKRCTAHAVRGYHPQMLKCVRRGYSYIHFGSSATFVEDELGLSGREKQMNHCSVRIRDVIPFESDDLLMCSRRGSGTKAAPVRTPRAHGHCEHIIMQNNLMA